MVKIIENYTLHEQIGEGEYGKVYRGVDGRTGREVAAKVVGVRRFRENPKLEECTLNEIEVLSRIDCPHIVRFIEILKTVNNFYFFYEYCNAGTLDALIRTHGPLPEPQLLAFLEQLIQAFRVLHANNIMHRDLKPSNIMLHNGTLKLGDFGFCKSLESQRDLAQTMLGSPIYMAPEVLRGEIYTVKADIWSLGVVVYEMAFGFCPFQESSIARLITLLDHQDLRLDRPGNPLSPHLEQLLRLMLVKDHFKRISWDELLNYPLRTPRTPTQPQLAKPEPVDQPTLPQPQQPRIGQTHQRVLSETNRLPRKDSHPEKPEIEKTTTATAEVRCFKKRVSVDEEDQREALREMLRTIDRCIQLNAVPELTCIVALKLYRQLLRAHSRLPPRKDCLKERFELTEAVGAVAGLLDSEDRENQLFDSAATSPKFAALLGFLREEGEGVFTSRSLERGLTEAGLLRA